VVTHKYETFTGLLSVEILQLNQVRRLTCCSSLHFKEV